MCILLYPSIVVSPHMTTMMMMMMNCGSYISVVIVVVCCLLFVLVGITLTVQFYLSVYMVVFMVENIQFQLKLHSSVLFQWLGLGMVLFNSVMKSDICPSIVACDVRVVVRVW